MFQLDPRQVDLQLFGNHHCDAGVGALAHLDIGRGQNNPPIAFDPNEGVGHESAGIGRFGSAACKRQSHTQHQAAACGDSGLQKRAPREARADGLGSWAIGDHRQPSFPIDCAARLIASRMRT